MKINEKKRYLNIFNNTKKAAKKINLKLSFDTGKKLISFFSRNQLKGFRIAAKCKHLKYFAQDCHRWNILNLVMYYGSKGEAFYKNKQSNILNISTRKFDYIIKDCIEQNHFIYAKPMKQKIKSNIKNIRPSESLLIAYTKYNIERLEKTLKQIKKFNIK